MRIKTDGLTPRELEITQYLACGLSHKEIAATICRSVSTVSNTLRGLYAKLALNKESEVVAWYLCRHYGASAEFDTVGKIRRALGAMMLIGLFATTLTHLDDEVFRRARRTRTRERIEETKHS